MRVPDTIKESVFYLCAMTADNPAKFALLGTGFFVGMPTDDGARTFSHLVTAKHVIEAAKKIGIDGNVYIRLNTLDGGFEYLRSAIDIWLTHPNDELIDVAVALALPDRSVFDYKAIGISMAITKDHKDIDIIGEGDEVFIAGLFINHYGRKKNIPIIRTGNIALMSDEPVQTAYGLTDAILIEARSIGGLSGSPVFVHKLGIGVENGTIIYYENGNPLYWLGLIHGHWDATTTTDNIVEDATDGAVNMGIAVIVPVDRIIEVINHPKHVKRRKEEMKKHAGDSSPTTDSATNFVEID